MVAVTTSRAMLLSPRRHTSLEFNDTSMHTSRVGDRPTLMFKFATDVCHRLVVGLHQMMLLLPTFLRI